MIKKAIIKFFQSHKETELDFSSGVNVITGASDQGKSAIAKALSWANFSRPSGTDYESTFKKENEVTEVTEVFESGEYITRRRNGILLNDYLTHDNGEDDPLEALRKGVPNEINDITKLKDYNIQKQHDSYFLLEETPGDVAKKFNNCAGIDIIDIVRKKINKAISKVSLRVSDSEDIIYELKNKLKKFTKMSKKESLFNKLETNILERDSKRKERTSLIALSGKIEFLEEEIEGIETWLKIEKDIKEIMSESRTLENEVLERDKVEKERRKILLIDDEITMSDYKDFKNINEIIEIVNELEIYIEESESLVGGKKEELNILYKELGSCPTCGQKITPELMIGREHA